MTDRKKCGCGKSQDMPYCDGSHKNPDILPEWKREGYFNKEVKPRYNDGSISGIPVKDRYEEGQVVKRDLTSRQSWTLIKTGNKLMAYPNTNSYFPDTEPIEITEDMMILADINGLDFANRNPTLGWHPTEGSTSITAKGLSVHGEVTLGGFPQDTTIDTSEFKLELLNPVSPEILAAQQDERHGTHTTITEMTREEIKEKFGVDIPANKYFTPSIEDIRVGYECECLWCCQEPRPWWPIVVLEEDLRDTKSLPIEEVYWRIKNKEIRVPYLTKEQIEKEGWEPRKSYFYKGSYVADYQNGLIMIWYFPSGKPSQKVILYNGACKDINTFRYICKLLAVNGK